MSAGVLAPRRDARRAETLLVELVGPAGVGKTTLTRALADRRDDIRCDLSLWDLPRATLLFSALTLLPVAARALARGRPLRAEELKQMIRLTALERVIARATRAGPSVIVMDEGPVFALAWFEVFFERSSDPVRADWRDRALDRWSSRLSAVVRLRAEDRVLAERIRWRAKPHFMKQGSDIQIFDFTARFRDAFDRVLDIMRQRGVAVRLLRTDQGPASERSHRLVETIEELRDGR